MGAALTLPIKLVEFGHCLQNMLGLNCALRAEGFVLSVS